MTKKLLEAKKYWPLYMMMIPGLAYLIINNYIPMAGIVIAFKKYTVQGGIFGSQWIGLQNFEFLFKGFNFGNVIRNTIGYNLAFLILDMVVGVTLAILLNDVISKTGRKIYQSAILLPYLISMVIVSYIAFGFLSVDNGLLNNSILGKLGMESVSWYSEAKYWPFILIFVNTWKTVGYSTLIYVASMAGIDPAFYEAAMLDGASKWQQIKNITLPCILPSITTLFLLNIGKFFYSDFSLFYQVPRDSGALYVVTDTIDTYVYRQLMTGGGIGNSAAAGFFQSVVGFALVIISNMIVRKVDSENALF